MKQVNAVLRDLFEHFERSHMAPDDKFESLTCISCGVKWHYDTKTSAFSRDKHAEGCPVRMMKNRIKEALGA